MATVPSIQAMRTIAGKGQKEIGNFIDSLMIKIWTEGALSQLCSTAAQLNSKDQRQSKMKQGVFRFVALRRKYHYLGYLKYKLTNREKKKDIMLPNDYFSALKKEELSQAAQSKSFFSRVLSSITSKKRKLEEQRLSVGLFETKELMQMLGTANIDENIQEQIFDWADLTLQKATEDLLKLYAIDFSTESSLNSSKGNFFEKEQ